MKNADCLSIWDLGQADSSIACRALLKTAQQHLQSLFVDQQADIDWLVHQQAHFVDEILQFLWQQHLPADTPISLIAVGGYGRGELHPFSDVDLLVLLDEPASAQPPEALTAFLTELWDMGLEIGHSVRTLQQCRAQAEDDITIATNLMEARFLCGRQDLFKDLQQLTVSNKTWD
ncbi:MAG: nucleotidyltransferase domain-containing protein, partial [Methylophaga sp.]|nr:nucleotidyltransferase domain-containing protein [Methylophaga sp.]